MNCILRATKRNVCDEKQIMQEFEGIKINQDKPENVSLHHAQTFVLKLCQTILINESET
jgi:hypothetical protein